MGRIKDCIERLRRRRDESRRRRIVQRASEIFTVDDYDGSLWLFCNGIGICPFSYVGKHTDEEIMKFLEDVREFYIRTE